MEDFISKALVMIEDKVDKLDPWQMQDLVGGLLQAMKYSDMTLCQKHSC